MTGTPSLDAVFVETVRLTGTHRDGSPIAGCYREYFAYYARWPHIGVALLLGLLPATNAMRSFAAPRAQSNVFEAPSSGTEP